jgi:hypothetical protein
MRPTVSVDGFGQFMRDTITEAGLPLECRPHGLRKAAGRSLAEAGCTQHEIMSALGLKALSEVGRYTGRANQSLMADHAVAKLRAIGRRRTGLAKPIRNVWERSQKMKQNQSEQIATSAP